MDTSFTCWPEDLSEKCFPHSKANWKLFFVFSGLWISTVCVCVCVCARMSFCGSWSAAWDYNRDFCLPGCRSSGHLVELAANQHHLQAVLRQAFCFSGSWTNPQQQLWRHVVPLVTAAWLMEQQTDHCVREDAVTRLCAAPCWRRARRAVWGCVCSDPPSAPLFLPSVWTLDAHYCPLRQRLHFQLVINSLCAEEEEEEEEEEEGQENICI